ncbi:BSD domain-containing protein 1 [Neosynchiropus ocellatus]
MNGPGRRQRGAALLSDGGRSAASERLTTHASFTGTFHVREWFNDVRCLGLVVHVEVQGGPGTQSSDSSAGSRPRAGAAAVGGTQNAPDSGFGAQVAQVPMNLTHTLKWRADRHLCTQQWRSSQSDNSSTETWWGGWLQQSIQAVKDKSSEALEFIKRDLTEFSTVVQHDTACSIAATATAVKNKLAVEGSSETTEKVKKSISSFLGVISDTLAPPPDKTIDCDVITLVATPAGTTEVYDSLKARLYSLQADPATYCNEPDGPPELFDKWLANFSLEEKKGEVSELLVSSPSIRALYTKMVPAAVSHSEFWQRYFYKVFQLDQDEARRVALKQRAEQTSHSETLGWEEEEEEGDFLGSVSSSQHSLSAPFDLSSFHVHGTLTPPAEAAPKSPILSPSEDRDPTLSASSDTVSLPTQVELHPESTVTRSEEKMTAVNTGDEAEEQKPERSLREMAEEAAPAEKMPAPKEEGPQDLRVFELNSDSGKSTPSNNGKKGSSTDVSEDWEKDFDLDMTEEEVQMALSKIEASGEQLDEDWENWE